MASIPDTSGLPRLLYVGDVRVEATLAGSLQLHRLLEHYPRQHLVICESNLQPAESKHRLPCKYLQFDVHAGRLLRTRFFNVAATYMYLSAASRAESIIQQVGGYAPQAILTVAHTYSWLTASAVAGRLQLPLHLIVHDNVVDTMQLPGLARRGRAQPRQSLAPGGRQILRGAVYGGILW